MRPALLPTSCARLGAAGSLAKYWQYTVIATSAGALGIPSGHATLPKLVNRPAPTSPETSSVQPCRPYGANAAGSGPPAHCDCEKPNSIRQKRLADGST